MTLAFSYETRRQAKIKRLSGPNSAMEN